jgi:micrococcal nuclease
MYAYLGRVINVVDGETVDIEIDLGFDLRRTDRFRLLGVRAPDPHGADQLLGDLATERLRDLLAAAVDGVVQVLTVRDRRDRYGRYLARVLVPTASGEVLDAGATLLAERLVRPSR